MSLSHQPAAPGAGLPALGAPAAPRAAVLAGPTPRIAVTPESPATEAARLLAAQRLGAVPVLDAAGRLVGLFSERDVVRVVAVRAAGLRGLAVEEVMSRDPATIAPGAAPEDALAAMGRSGLRHLPVCGPDGRLIGLVGLPELIRRG